MIETIKKRVRNRALWLSIFSLIPLVLEGCGLDVLPENYSEITNAILSVLVLAGIVNNPTTDNKWYKDE